jgi:hypothetical protein
MRATTQQERFEARAFFADGSIRATRSFTLDGKGNTLRDAIQNCAYNWVAGSHGHDLCGVPTVNPAMEVRAEGGEWVNAVDYLRALQADADRIAA